MILILLAELSYIINIFNRLELKFAEDEFKKKQEEYKMLFDREKDRATRAEVC